MTPLGHVRWIGGGSGAGKSTLARRLAAEHGLAVYATDDVIADHSARLGPDEAPELDRFRAMTMDERWVDRDPRTMLDTFHWFRGEGFGLIVEDLRATGPGVVLVEGFRLLPSLVAPLLDDPSHALWLLPSPEFRERVFAGRGWPISRRTGHPERARHNLLERDRLFTDHLARECVRLDLQAVDVHIGLDEDATLARVARMLGLR